MKKKVLITTDSFLPRWDGVAKILDEILPVLAKDFSLTIIAPKFRGTMKKASGITYHLLPLGKHTFGDITFAKTSRKELLSYVAQHDVIFNHTIGPIGIHAIRAAERLNKPLIHYIHTIDWELASKSVRYFQTLVRYAVKRIARYMHNKTSLLLVPSRAVDDIIHQNKVLTKKILVPLGINIKLFTPIKNKKKAKKALRLNPTSPVIGYIGRISREKNLNTLITAFKEVKKNYKRAKLLIVGDGLQHELPKDKDIIFVKGQRNIVPYLHAMDIFVLPSLTETTSLVTMEAMACELPVIVTPVGKIPEYVDDGKNGLLFSRKDYEALANKIEWLLDDKNFAKELGKNARKTIVKRFPLTRTITKIRKILREV